MTATEFETKPSLYAGVPPALLRALLHVIKTDPEAAVRLVPWVATIEPVESADDVAPNSIGYVTNADGSQTVHACFDGTVKSSARGDDDRDVAGWIFAVALDPEIGDRRAQWGWTGEFMHELNAEVG